jgi:hypothetical protein
MPPIYAFVHIPFSAGTTVRNAILASHGGDEVFDCYGWRRTSPAIANEIRALSPARRERVKFLLGHQVWFGIDELFDREVRYFTFLRNPISRTVSAYWKIQRDERNFYHDIVRSMTLEQFAHDLPICRNHATVILSREAVDDGHNFAACVDEDQAMLARAKANRSLLVYRAVRNVCGRLRGTVRSDGLCARAAGQRPPGCAGPGTRADICGFARDRPSQHDGLLPVFGRADQTRT